MKLKRETSKKKKGGGGFVSEFTVVGIREECQTFLCIRIMQHNAFDHCMVPKYSQKERREGLSVKACLAFATF